MTTFVKICGTTNLVDALASLELGADALGFIFVEESKRRVDPELAKDVIAELPQGAQVFGVFVNEPASYVAEVVREIGLTGVQLHGEESPQQVSSIRQATEELQIKIIKTIPASIVQQHTLGYFAGGEELVDAIMVDSGSEQKRGGTGKPFDWMRAASAIAEVQRRNKVIIAGGLTPANVSAAVALLRPWAVDAVTGLESEPGKKDHAKLRAFISAVRAVNISAPSKAVI